MKQIRILVTGGLLLASALVPLAGTPATASAGQPPITPLPGAAPVQASGANGRIAFSTGFVQPEPDLSGNSQVYTVNPDGTDVRQLTHVAMGSQAGDPDWSPEGSRIAYVSNVSGNFDVMVMNADGSGQHAIAHTPDWNYYTPRWSPDGRQIAVTRCYALKGYEINCDIDLMNADGSGRHILVGSHVMNQYPDWSPDGSHIVFSSNRAGLLQAVWMVDATGGGLRRMTDPNLEAQYPQWSPLGNRILFANNFDRPHTNTYVLNPARGRVRQVTHVERPHSAFFASWAPDGRHIVFISDFLRHSRGADLLTANGNGTNITQIVIHHPRVTYADWGTFTSTDTANQ